MNKKHFDAFVERNGSGYIDPTAAEGITRADADYERFKKLLNLIFKICELSGFHLEGRITVRDEKTGKIWR